MKRLLTFALFLCLATVCSAQTSVTLRNLNATSGTLTGWYQESPQAYNGKSGSVTYTFNAVASTDVGATSGALLCELPPMYGAIWFIFSDPGASSAQPLNLFDYYLLDKYSVSGTYDVLAGVGADHSNSATERQTVLPATGLPMWLHGRYVLKMLHLGNGKTLTLRIVLVR